MDRITLAVISLRASALAATLAGQPKAATALYSLADLVEAGRASDAHMKAVAEKLKNADITDSDWDDVMNRIQADSNRLQGTDDTNKNNADANDLPVPVGDSTSKVG